MMSALSAETVSVPIRSYGVLDGRDVPRLDGVVASAAVEAAQGGAAAVANEVVTPPRLILLLVPLRLGDLISTM